MAMETKILSDTKTHAKVLLTFTNDSSLNSAAVDASALSGHNNGAKLHITHINHGISGFISLLFEGDADVGAINISGSGIYYGAVIKNTATNTGASGGDINANTSNCNGYVLLTLQKEGFAENA